MKMMLRLLSFVAMTATLGAIEPRQPRVVTLYKDQIADVYISDQVTTVLQFAEKVSMVTGAGLSDGTTECSVQFEHPKDSRTVVLRGVGKSGRVLMQVMSGNEFYAFCLNPSAEPDSVLRLAELEPEARAVVKAPAELSLPEAKIQEVVTRACEAFGGKQVAGVEVRRVHNLRNGEGVAALVEMVGRSPQDDVVVLKGLVINSGSDDLNLSGHSATLIVAESREISPVRFQPSQEILPPGGKGEFVLVCVGDGNGGRANLSIKNRFDVLVRADK